MIRVAICDDEPAQVELLAAMTALWSDRAGISAAVSSYSSAESFFFAWSEDRSFDAQAQYYTDEARTA
ncbi:hypothetical protein [Gorillibacterium timonense]|uniref:hypothetical protein n=1 Tax=Gorillibacterium timonense TaxID=1689269 RepID=UPI00071DDBAE|nr:hypothetical protein [Gorillibacterium timonense]